MRALCIFTTLLGNKATTRRVIEILDRMEGVTPIYELIGLEDYAKYPAPRWARLSDAWESRYIARQKFRSLDHQSFDFLFVNAWELVTEFQDLASTMPALALMDAVPETVNAQLRRQGHAGAKRWISNRLNDGPFRIAARRFKFFLPMGSDCADALHNYGIPPERCTLALSPQDLDVWKPRAGKSFNLPLKLLFVGNDFARKGGAFLLDLYARRLASFSTLTIASNDSSLERLHFPPGVEWLRGRSKDQLLDTYHSAHVFVFPTRQDYMPQVLGEALATGVPCIANDVGGIHDLIRDGETGYLMSVEDQPERWAEKLRHLSGHPEELERLSVGARAFAQRELGLERFEQKLQNAIRNLALIAR